jgi:hypothetical protein
MGAPLQVVIPAIRGCVRCGGEHLHVLAQLFAQPPDGATHWATCPVTGDPILITVTPEPPGRMD